MVGVRTDSQDYPNVRDFRAFPSKGFGGSVDTTNQQGMDILDWFATAAMNGVLQKIGPPLTPAQVATECFDIAEAMIAASITRHVDLPI